MIRNIVASVVRYPRATPAILRAYLAVRSADRAIRSTDRVLGTLGCGR